LASKTDLERKFGSEACLPLPQERHEGAELTGDDPDCYLRKRTAAPIATKRAILTKSREISIRLKVKVFMLLGSHRRESLGDTCREVGIWRSGNNVSFGRLPQLAQLVPSTRTGILAEMQSLAHRPQKLLALVRASKLEKRERERDENKPEA
jgi:hypothetical protein